MREESIYQHRSCAEEYDEDRFGGSFGRFLRDREVETFLSMMGKSQGSVLDVGAGTGKLSLPLLLRSRQVFSIDSSVEMIRIACRKADREGVFLRPVICDAHHLCFRDHTLDCVVSSRVLMHLTDWRKALADLSRVSKGMVVVDFPALWSFSGVDSLLKRGMRLIQADTRTYRAFRVSSVVRELEKNNFRIVEMRRQFFLPLAVHRRLENVALSRRIERVCEMLGLVRLLGSPIVLKAVNMRTCRHGAGG